MKHLIDDIKRHTPKSIPGYYYLKTQNIYIPFMKVTIECLTRKISELNLFFESVLKLIEISVTDINEIADILGVSYSIVKEAIIDMVSVDYIYASENNLDITAKGKAALKTRQRVDIQKTYLKDIIVDMITGVVYDADTVKVSNPHPRDVLLESVIKIDSSYLDSHFQEINSLYQLSLKNNSIFGNSSVTSELYKIIGISYSELHYAENRVYMYKSESSDELKFEFFLDDSDKYKNEFYTQMKEHCRPCQEYFFEKSRDFVNRIAGQPIKIEPSLIEQAEIARKMLFADNVADDTKTDIFTKKRYALNDREYMSYLYNSKVLKYKRIFVCSNHVNGLLSYFFCSQLNVLAEKIPVFLIYNKNEYGAEKTIRYFFRNPSSNLFLIASEEVDESIICFDSELAMYLQENAISAFERPVVYTMSTCDFDKKAVSKLSGMLIAKYNLAGYLSETSTQNNASPRKQKSNN